ncbi:antitoxin YefM [Eubacterium uniforme]|uniref:Antitoxin n=1 Tax=Eubacterium uniforme TaxID=39495 RepID=A0A1T4V7W0_9FIRM|nr:type II toxin-antitoxin system Phd/YefM family antitoxin [Eubacterium uniforme]SKA60952.1 antitoxin YefM [Eubacterium uniforme]
MKIAQCTDVRNNIKDYCKYVVENNDVVVITRKDNKNVVLMDFERYNNLLKMEEFYFDKIMEFLGEDTQKEREIKANQILNNKKK